MIAISFNNNNRFSFHRHFSLVLKQHRNLVSNITKFRIQVKNGQQQSTDYEPKTAYTGIVQGIGFYSTFHLLSVG